MKTLWTIIKKELKRFFTDKRTLISIFLPGIALYLLYSVMGSFISSKNEEFTTIKEANICLVNEPEEFKEFFENDMFKNANVQHFNDLSEEEAKKKIEDEELHLYVVFDSNFINAVTNYDAIVSEGKNAPQVKVFYKSSNSDSSLIADAYISYLNAFEANISNKFDINSDKTIKYDLSEEDDMSTMILSMIVPFLLIIMLFSSSMGLCAESIAGEKERGTIATLLNTPAKRWQLALGKVTSLAIVSMCAGLVSSVGAILSIPSLLGSDAVSLGSYGFGSFALLAVVIIVTSIFFAAILSVVSTFAKSVKEASSLCLIPMMLTFAIGMLSMFSTSASNNLWVYLIPVYNSVQCFNQVMNLAINPLTFLIAIISNIGYIALCIFGVSKMFNNEKVMFSK